MASFKYKSVNLVFAVLLSYLLGVYALVPRHHANATTYPYYPLLERDTRPAFPSLDDCRAAIQTVPADTAVFFTNTGGKDAIAFIKLYAQSVGLSHVTEEAPTTIWNPKDFYSIPKYSGTADQRNQFISDFSQAYAEKASGTAYLVMSYAKLAPADRVFYSVEFAAIKAAGTVTRIIWLDQDNLPDDPTAITKIWWNQGDPDPPTDGPATATSGPLCGLGNYWDAFHCPLNDGIDYLESKGNGQWCADANSCSMPSCSYGTGISLCNDNSVQYCTSFAELADQAWQLQRVCDPNALLTNDEVDCSTTTTQAMQQFFSDGHNVLITGGYGC